MARLTTGGNLTPVSIESINSNVELPITTTNPLDVDITSPLANGNVKVTLYDSDGNPVTLNTSFDQLATTDFKTKEVLDSILFQLKLQNAYLSHILGETLDMFDIEE